MSEFANEEGGWWGALERELSWYWIAELEELEWVEEEDFVWINCHLNIAFALSVGFHAVHAEFAEGNGLSCRKWTKLTR
jgi:hypothetical protein